MSARVPAEPKYRHFKPKNLGVVRIDGRDHYLGRYGTPESMERYHRLLAEWSATGRVEPTRPEPAATPEAALTIDELILRFWRHGETYYRHADGTPTGEMENFKYALRPLRELFGGTAAEEFGPKSLKLVRQRMIDTGLSRGVVNARIKRIVMVFSFGVENDLLPRNAAMALREVKSLTKGRTAARETEPIKPAPDEHVDAILPHVAPQVRAMIALQRLTGMRSGEVTSMRTGDIDRSGVSDSVRKGATFSVRWDPPERLRRDPFGHGLSGPVGA